MLVVFVDFDGVLHRAGNGLEHVGPHFLWLPILSRALAAHPDVVLAVHSTWRYQYSISELRELLASTAPRTITAVPRGPRAEAIRWFLQMNPLVTEYRVLDDDLDEFDPPPDELLLCDPSMGITTPGIIGLLTTWLEQTKPALP